MSTFDPSTFLDATISEPSVRQPPLSPGDYHATITDVKPRQWSKKDDPSVTGIALDVTMKIEKDTNPGMPTGITQTTVTQGIMLNLTEGGAIDNAPGKNSTLRRYREALDMNKAGDVFSPRNMIGRNLKVKIKHRMYEGEAYNEVDSVSAP